MKINILNLLIIFGISSTLSFIILLTTGSNILAMLSSMLVGFNANRMGFPIIEVTND